MKAPTVNGRSDPAWEVISGSMRVVRLTLPVRILIPALIFPSLSSSTRGITLYPGRMGLVIGAVLVAIGILVGYLLVGVVGIIGPFVSIWFLGSVGAATLFGAFRPVAYVKPICVECRLLPVIKEHEAIHLTGVGDEEQVWGSMRTRHTVQSLALAGDPAICSFCPIPKRLAER